MQNNFNNIELLAQSNKSIYTTADLAVIWGITDRRRLIELIKYYLRSHRLSPIKKGVYAYGTKYTNLDIAQKLVPLSYISLYTSSQIHGLTFQNYSTTFAMSLSSRKYSLPVGNFEYHRLKSSAFYNSTGLIQKSSYTIASPERTIVDCLYVYPNFAFDKICNINLDLLQAITSLYNNHSLTLRINKLIKNI